MSDIVTRLLLNSGDYDKKMSNAKKSSDDFASNIGGKVAGMVGKFAAGIGVAMGGVEAFNKMMASSQTMGDQWNNTLSACKGTVDAFFQSLASGNWDAFNGGLIRTLENMYQLSALKDQLSDAKLSMGFEQRQFEREYVRLEGIIDDETKTKAQRKDAFADMQTLVEEFKKRVEATGKGAAQTLVKEMNTKFGQEFTLGDIETYIREVNNEFLNTETLQRLNKYKETLALFNDGRSRSFAEYGGLVMTKEQYQQKNPFLEKMRILQDDKDESRKRMVEDYEYMLEIFQRADEYLKRSLEKQSKIAALDKGGPVVQAARSEYKSYSAAGTSLGMAATMPTSLEKIKIPIKGEDVDAVYGYADGINAVASAMSAINGATAEGAAGWLAWASSVMTASAQAVEAISKVVAAKTAEGVASAGASAASTPVVGWLMIGGAIAAALAAFAAIPKFAEGGTVGGSSYIGDKLLARVNSGETILTQRQSARALSLMDGRNVRLSGDVRLSGKDIYISMRNYMSASGNKL